MAEIKLPEIKPAVEIFVNKYKDLRFLPFLSDAEADLLYGGEVAAAVAELERCNREKSICTRCRQHCCLRVRCEFYDPGFSRCMVENFRPALCRLHYCNEFEKEHAALVKVLGDIFLESLLAAQKEDPDRIKLFDCPAFSPSMPALTGQIKQVLVKARTSPSAEAEACLEIQRMIESYYDKN